MLLYEGFIYVLTFIPKARFLISLSFTTNILLYTNKTEIRNVLV